MGLKNWLCLATILSLSASVSSISLAYQSPQTPEGPAYTIETETSRVLVPVVVRDAHGTEISDLKAEDFQVKINGKQAPIKHFWLQKRQVPAADVLHGSQQKLSAVNSSQSAETSRRFIVLLFDDLHLKFEDLSHLQTAAQKMLDQSIGEADYADVLTTSAKTNSGFTTDRTKLQQAIREVHQQGLARADAEDCPKLSYYQADQIANKHDVVATNEAVSQVFNCNPGMNRQRDAGTAERMAESAAERVAMQGSQDVQATYAMLRKVVHGMANLPGQRDLVFLSPGFLAADSHALTAESEIIDMASQANVTINCLDARGLYTTSLDASQNIVGNPQTQFEMHQRTMTSEENPMAELANGTGGTFFHNSNDMDAGLKALMQAPQSLYVLEVSPDGQKLDGAYHHLQVIVDRPGSHVQARSGYFAPKPGKKK